MKKEVLALAIISMILLLPIAQALTYVTRDWDFNNGTTYWAIVYPSWNDRPDINTGWISGGYAYLKVYDEDGGDWSDTVAIQGKKVHESGYYNGYSLPYTYEATYAELCAGSKPLKATIRFMVPETPQPIQTKSYVPWVSPWPCVAGVFILAFFEYYYYDSTTGTYKWTNINNPNSKDGIPDCLVVEIANRWYYDTVYSTWFQANDVQSDFNFYTFQTTHDTDLHYIRAGLIVTTGQYKTFNIDIAGHTKQALDCFKMEYLLGYFNQDIQKVRLVGFAVSVEAYRATIRAYIDYAYLYIP